MELPWASRQFVSTRVLTHRGSPLRLTQPRASSYASRMNLPLRDLAPFAEFASGIEWEETPCLLCGADNWSPLVEAPDFTADGIGRWFMVVQCRDCGLCFTNPRPSPESIGQFYRDNYKPHRAPEREGATHWWRRLQPMKRLQPRTKFLPLQGDGRLLDFGCGGGLNLLRMRAQGWNVIGVDVSIDVVEMLRDKFGLNVLAGSLPHPELPDDSFDAVTMWHSLEHTHQPFEVLHAARRLLVSGGKLIVGVPNIDCLPFRWFGQAWNALDLPRHLTHFAPWTLRLMLQRAGFRQIRVYMHRRSSWLRECVRLAAELRPLSPWRRALKRRFISSVVSWYACVTRQSDSIIAEAVKP